MAPRKLNDVERELLAGLEELARDLKAETPLDEKYTCHRLELDLKPGEYGPEEVLAARQVLKASQALFAQFLGVSPKTVRGWESGKPVSAIASRFMDEIRNDPTYWRERWRSSAKAQRRRASDVAQDRCTRASRNSRRKHR